MSKRFGRVRSALGFFCAMALSAAAMAGSAAVAAPVAPAGSATVARVVLPGDDARLRQHSTGSARPLAAADVRGHRAAVFAGEKPEKPPTPARKAKSYALVLASFGMLGVIALQRLTKIF